MPRPYVPYICQSLGDLWDFLGTIFLSSPRFIDKTGYFPHFSLETVFFELDESLKHLRKKLGEERYAAMADRATRMRASFASDPENKNGGAAEGRRLLHEMEDLLRKRRADPPPQPHAD